MQQLCTAPVCFSFSHNLENSKICYADDFYSLISRSNGNLTLPRLKAIFPCLLFLAWYSPYILPPSSSHLSLLLINWINAAVYLPVLAHSMHLPVFLVFLSSLTGLWLLNLLLQNFLVTVLQLDRRSCRFSTTCRWKVLERLCRVQN